MKKPWAERDSRREHAWVREDKEAPS